MVSSKDGTGTVRHKRKTIENNQGCKTVKHQPASRGGRGYDLNIQHQALLLYLQGDLDHPIVNDLCNQGFFLHRRTFFWYQRRLMQHSHCHRYRATGNREPMVLEGHVKLLLRIFKAVYPTVTAAEVNALLWNAHRRFQNPTRLYHPSQITQTEQELGLTRKVCSTTAFQANTPRVLLWRQMYWHSPYPFGIADITQEDMIDVDEAKVILSTCNRKQGKGPSFQRVRTY